VVPARNSPSRTIIAGRLVISIGPPLETCLVTLTGELGSSNAPALRDELHRLLSSEHETALLLDLQQLEFIDSGGIHCLLQTTAESRTNGDRFRILGALDSHVDRVIRVSGTRELLPFIV
jgi:anti-anti-sigma factor